MSKVGHSSGNRNRYLEDLGLKPGEYGVNVYPGAGEDFVRRSKHQRRMYGFDERETYELYRTFAEWLYSRLMMYREKASPVIVLDRWAVDFEGRIYTQAEAVDRMIDWIGYYLWHCNGDRSEKAFLKLQRATRLWAAILPYMGW